MIYTYKQVIDNKLFFGGKVNNLLQLLNIFSIPKGFIISSEFKEEDFFNIKLDINKKYIIRSSANIEDSQKTSCAGLFKSKLIKGEDDLFKETQRLYNETDFENINLFLNHIGIKKEVTLNFLLQEFIYGDFSGVYFSNYDGEEFFEYVKGSNSLLVDGKVNSSKVIFDKDNFEIKNNIQDFYLDENFKDISFNKKPILEEKIIFKLIKTFREVSELFDYDVDLEWTVKGEKIYILQVRGIVF